MKLIIFRHGQTDGNVKNIVQGAGVDCPLNETGMKQAETLKEKLSGCNLRHIYSSKLTRALQTAAIVASSNNAAIIPLDGLEEVHYGEAEGMLSEEAHKKYAYVFDIIRDKNNPAWLDTSIPGAETIRISTERGLNALYKIKEECADNVVGVACHGALMFNLFRHFFEEEHRFDNCEYFEVEI